MDGILNLVVLYIIYMVFSSVFKAMKSKSPPAQQQRKKQTSKFQQSGGQYAGKLEQYLEQQQAQPQTASQAFVPERSSLQAPSLDELLQAEALTSEDTELEQILATPPTPVPQAAIPRYQAKLRRSSKVKHRKAQQRSSLLAFDKHRGYLQGIILSEILGPPVSKRNSRGKRCM